MDSLLIPARSYIDINTLIPYLLSFQVFRL